MFEDFRLRVFETVARTGGFTSAANELGVSQPAVSQNIAELEKITGGPLFIRERGGLSLTDNGTLFLEYAKKILYWYDRCRAVVIEKTGTPAEPTFLNLEDGRVAEISAEDGAVKIKLI